jgi:hypothetical protein
MDGSEGGYGGGGCLKLEARHESWFFSKKTSCFIYEIHEIQVFSASAMREN